MVRKGAGRSNDPVLQAKYLDWCSARVANRFVKLTPEEIYQLAERAARDQQARGGERAGLASQREPKPGAEGRADAAAEAAESEDRALGADMSFRAIVERVTEALAAELDLPDFDEWAMAYRSDPTRFDDELLGLWREPL